MMDIATVIGLGLCVTAVIGAIFAGGDMAPFIDVPSVIVVGLGLIGATFIKLPMEVVKNLMSFAMKTIFLNQLALKKLSMKLEVLQRQQGVNPFFALEKVPIEDAFLKKAMTLAADNRPPEVINSILKWKLTLWKSDTKLELMFLMVWRQMDRPLG